MRSTRSKKQVTTSMINMGISSFQSQQLKNKTTDPLSESAHLPTWSPRMKPNSFMPSRRTSPLYRNNFPTTPKSSPNWTKDDNWSLSPETPRPNPKDNGNSTADDDMLSVYLQIQKDVKMHHEYSWSNTSTTPVVTEIHNDNLSMEAKTPPHLNKATTEIAKGGITNKNNNWTMSPKTPRHTDILEEENWSMSPDTPRERCASPDNWSLSSSNTSSSTNYVDDLGEVNVIHNENYMDFRSSATGKKEKVDIKEQGKTLGTTRRLSDHVLQQKGIHHRIQVRKDISKFQKQSSSSRFYLYF